MLTSAYVFANNKSSATDRTRHTLGKTTERWFSLYVSLFTAYLNRQLYNLNMTVCSNCYHKRQFHKKVDGNAWCSVSYCACKQFIEAEVSYDRRAIHEALDQFLDGIHGDKSNT